MARVKNFILGQLNGKLGNYVFYQRGEETLVREIGENNTPPTVKQLFIRMKFKIVSQVLAPIKDFIKVGFAFIAARVKKEPLNVALAHNLKNGVKGAYPDLEINFEQLMISVGNLDLPDDLAVELNATGLVFTWNKNPTMGHKWNDRTMIMAYFPALKRAAYNTAGAKFHVGRDELILYGVPRGTVVETYIAFSSEDGKEVSNSVYMGRLIW